MGRQRGQHTCGIYEIVNLLNGKRYVGSSVDIERRWKDHRDDLAAHDHDNAHFEAAWYKYGPDAFEWRILMIVPRDELKEYEQSLLDRFFPTGILYNLSDNATAPWRGKHLSPEHGAKIAEANRRRVVSAETRAKMAAASTGRRHSPETIAKMKEIHKDRRPSPEAHRRGREVCKARGLKPPYQGKRIRLSRGEQVLEFPSGIAAGAFLGVTGNAVGAALSKGRKCQGWSVERV